MQNQVDLLRQLNYELIKELGLFQRRANLSFSQRHLLYHIESNAGLSIQELAEFLHVEHSTMSRNIKKMVRDGLVEIYQDEKDKRRKVVLLSSLGAKNLAEATQSINQTISKVTEILNEQEVTSIIEGIRKYSNALKG